MIKYCITADWSGPKPPPFDRFFLSTNEELHSYLSWLEAVYKLVLDSHYFGETTGLVIE